MVNPEWLWSSSVVFKEKKGIEKILEKYHLTEYDAYKLLKHSGARLPIDTYEFIDPNYVDNKI